MRKPSSPGTLSRETEEVDAAAHHGAQKMSSDQSRAAADASSTSTAAPSKPPMIMKTSLPSQKAQLASKAAAAVEKENAPNTDASTGSRSRRAVALDRKKWTARAKADRRRNWRQPQPQRPRSPSKKKEEELRPSHKEVEEKKLPASGEKSSYSSVQSDKRLYPRKEADDKSLTGTPKMKLPASEENISYSSVVQSGKRPSRRKEVDDTSLMEASKKASPVSEEKSSYSYVQSDKRPSQRKEADEKSLMAASKKISPASDERRSYSSVVQSDNRDEGGNDNATNYNEEIVPPSPSTATTASEALVIQLGEAGASALLMLDEEEEPRPPPPPSTTASEALVINLGQAALMILEEGEEEEEPEPQPPPQIVRTANANSSMDQEVFEGANFNDQIYCNREPEEDRNIVRDQEENHDDGGGGGGGGSGGSSIENISAEHCTEAEITVPLKTSEDLVAVTTSTTEESKSSFQSRSSLDNEETVKSDDVLADLVPPKTITDKPKKPIASSGTSQLTRAALKGLPKYKARKAVLMQQQQQHRRQLSESSGKISTASLKSFNSSIDAGESAQSLVSAGGSTTHSTSSRMTATTTKSQLSSLSSRATRFLRDKKDIRRRHGASVGVGGAGAASGRSGTPVGAAIEPKPDVMAKYIARDIIRGKAPVTTSSKARIKLKTYASGAIGAVAIGPHEVEKEAGGLNLKSDSPEQDQSERRRTTMSTYVEPQEINLKPAMIPKMDHRLFGLNREVDAHQDQRQQQPHYAAVDRTVSAAVYPSQGVPPLPPPKQPYQSPIGYPPIQQHEHDAAAQQQSTDGAQGIDLDLEPSLMPTIDQRLSRLNIEDDDQQNQQHQAMDTTPTASNPPRRDLFSSSSQHQLRHQSPATFDPIREHIAATQHQQQEEFRDFTREPSERRGSFVDHASVADESSHLEMTANDLLHTAWYDRTASQQHVPRTNSPSPPTVGDAATMETGSTGFDASGCQIFDMIESTLSGLVSTASSDDRRGRSRSSSNIFGGFMSSAFWSDQGSSDEDNTLDGTLDGTI